MDSKDKIEKSPEPEPEPEPSTSTSTIGDSFVVSCSNPSIRKVPWDPLKLFPLNFFSREPAISCDIEIFPNSIDDSDDLSFLAGIDSGFADILYETDRPHSKFRGATIPMFLSLICQDSHNKVISKAVFARTFHRFFTPPQIVHWILWQLYKFPPEFIAVNLFQLLSDIIALNPVDFIHRRETTSPALLIMAKLSMFKVPSSLVTEKGYFLAELIKFTVTELKRHPYYNRPGFPQFFQLVSDIHSKLYQSTSFPKKLLFKPLINKNDPCSVPLSPTLSQTYVYSILDTHNILVGRLLETCPFEFARQISILDWNLFIRIRPSELTTGSWISSPYTLDGHDFNFPLSSPLFQSENYSSSFFGASTSTSIPSPSTSKFRKNQPIHFVKMSIEFFNLIHQFILHLILKVDNDSKLQAAVLQWCILVGMSLFKIRNFNSLRALLMAIFSLRTTQYETLWRNLDKKTKHSKNLKKRFKHLYSLPDIQVVCCFESHPGNIPETYLNSSGFFAKTLAILEQHNSSKRGFQVYRRSIRNLLKNQLRVIPYLGITLTDCIFTIEGNLPFCRENPQEDLVKSKEPVFVNYIMLRLLSEVIQPFQSLFRDPIKGFQFNSVLKFIQNVASEP